MYFLIYHNPGPILKRGFGDFSKILFSWFGGRQNLGSQWGKSSIPSLRTLTKVQPWNFHLGKKIQCFFTSAFGRMTRDPEFKKHVHPPKMGGKIPPKLEFWRFFWLGFPKHFGRVSANLLTGFVGSFSGKISHTTSLHQAEGGFQRGEIGSGASLGGQGGSQSWREEAGHRGGTGTQNIWLAFRGGMFGVRWKGGAFIWLWVWGHGF